MRTLTIGPISGNDVRDLTTAPYAIEGKGPDALLIYFDGIFDLIRTQRERSRSCYTLAG